MISILDKQKFLFYGDIDQDISYDAPNNYANNLISDLTYGELIMPLFETFNKLIDLFLSIDTGVYTKEG